MKTPTQTLAAALRILAKDIESPDGVANAAIAEAAERLEELTAQVEVLRRALTDIRHSPDDHCAEIAADALDSKPNQCLREIQAEAGRAGYLQGAKEWCKIGNENDELMLSDAEYYANLIRKGGE
jgi:sirohydrochlorin ferrochelatase